MVTIIWPNSYIIIILLRRLHMDHTETINVIVEGQKMTIPAKFAQVSEYIRSLQALGFDEQEEIEVDSVSKQTFQQILAFYNLCNYQEVFIKTPIRTSNIRDVLTSNYCEFLQKHPIESAEFKNLIKGCEFLGCKNLMRVCAARCACYLYFEDSKEAFEQKQKELKVKINVEFQDNEKFKKLYPFMNS